MFDNAGCGMNLRGEDHAAMKSFVLSVQNRANELKASSGNGPNGSSKRVCLHEYARMDSLFPSSVLTV